MDAGLIEDLKAEGLFFAAGAFASQIKNPRAYGCHYGLRRDIDAARAEFYRGFDAAEVGGPRQ